MSRLMPRPYPCLVIRQLTPRSPASLARTLRLLEASLPVTSDDLELQQYYLAQLRQRPTWRAWPPVSPVVVHWPQVPARQLELQLKEVS